MYWRNIKDGDVVASLPAPHHDSFVVRVAGAHDQPGSPVFWSAHTGGPTGYAPGSYGEKFAAMAFCAERDVNRTPEERETAAAQWRTLDARQRDGSVGCECLHPSHGGGACTSADEVALTHSAGGPFIAQCRPCHSAQH